MESYETESDNVFMLFYFFNFFLLFYISIIYLWVIIYMHFLKLAPNPIMGTDYVGLD